MNNSNNNLLSGLVIGAALGAGITFLFGTKKGKEIRSRVKDEYPEIFNKLEEVINNISEEAEQVKDETSEVFAEKLDSVATAVADLRDHVTTHPRRFLKSGKKL